MSLDDMFLKVESKRQGTIKGESKDAVHTDEIDIVSWSWGMRASTTLGAAGPTGRATLHELIVVKFADSASTALMSAMNNNEDIKKTKLTVRKAGDHPLEYVVITLENSRITSYQVDSSGMNNNKRITETLSFAYRSIDIEYVPQGDDGSGLGSHEFFATIEPS